MSNVRVNNFAIDSNTEIMPTVDENGDIQQIIDEELNEAMCFIVDDDNINEHANKRQRMYDNAMNGNNFDNNLLQTATTNSPESPVNSNTSTGDGNTAQERVTSSFNNTTYKTKYRMSCKEYYNKINKSKKILLCMCLDLKDENNHPLDYETDEVYKTTKVGRKLFIPGKAELQDEVTRRSYLYK